MNARLRTFVEEKLRDDLSPAAIGGRLAGHEHDLPVASKDSIYRFLKSPYGRKIEYERQKKHPNRRSRSRRSLQLQHRTFIDERPLSIDRRLRLGDTEGDFIVSGRTGKGVLLVVVDRKLRFLF